MDRNLMRVRHRAILHDDLHCPVGSTIEVSVSNSVIDRLKKRGDLEEIKQEENDGGCSEVSRRSISPLLPISQEKLPASEAALAEVADVAREYDWAGPVEPKASAAAPAEVPVDGEK